MIQNMIRAARLDKEFYNTVEHDASFTGQAGAVVALAYTLSGIGLWIGPSEGLIRTVLISVIAGLVGWVVWAFLTNVIGTALGGTADTGEMLRVLGFAQAPIAIGIIPFLSFVGLIWMFVAAVVAVREGLDFTTGKAIGTIILGWLVLVVVQAVIGLVL